MLFGFAPRKWNSPQKAQAFAGGVSTRFLVKFLSQLAPLRFRMDTPVLKGDFGRESYSGVFTLSARTALNIIVIAVLALHSGTGLSHQALAIAIASFFAVARSQSQRIPAGRGEIAMDSAIAARSTTYL